AWPNSSWKPPSLTPSLSNVCSASFNAKAVCTHAFVGMQPMRRHVPPSSGSRSMHTVFAPSCAARIAAVYPPGPPPRTATSASITLDRTSPLQGHAHGDRFALVADRAEAVPLVQRRRAVRRAQAQRFVAFGPRVGEQGLHQLVA